MSSKQKIKAKRREGARYNKKLFQILQKCKKAKKNGQTTCCWPSKIPRKMEEELKRKGYDIRIKKNKKYQISW